ncbi:PaaI family thioesterase [Pseudodonghicola flavimaris]|uniref:PaaI family thioesterase n=1 Tax=Pseudodonghicola flavimaris TaxID=3050036 RepID=A0ABT7F5W1_9RHOB|nr:PaaI family thioesterase [Pseudodonghicola flavimaris]MDK3019998.1 PaaI family thioesterase [Pseudodonghicola flavimaris]
MKYAESLDDLLSPEELSKLSGLEFMEAMRDGRLPAPPISRTLNYRLHQIEKGRVVFRGRPGFDFTNPLGSVHGGWYGTLLDSSMACAVQTMVDRGATYTTLEYKINILRPVPIGVEVDSIGIADHVGRSTGVAHGEIRGVADDKLYATGSTTCIVMRLPG